MMQSHCNETLRLLQLGSEALIHPARVSHPHTLNPLSTFTLVIPPSSRGVNVLDEVPSPVLCFSLGSPFSLIISICPTSANNLELNEC